MGAVGKEALPVSLKIERRKASIGKRIDAMQKGQLVEHVYRIEKKVESTIKESKALQREIEELNRWFAIDREYWECVKEASENGT